MSLGQMSLTLAPSVVGPQGLTRDLVAQVLQPGGSGMWFGPRLGRRRRRSAPAPAPGAAPTPARLGRSIYIENAILFRKRNSGAQEGGRDDERDECGCPSSSYSRAAAAEARAQRNG